MLTHAAKDATDIYTSQQPGRIVADWKWRNQTTPSQSRLFWYFDSTICIERWLLIIIWEISLAVTKIICPNFLFIW